MTRFVDSKLTLREWLPLIGITVSAFIFNTSEFMPVGLLTGIGASFGTSEGVTGLIISVYAWAVMLLSLPLMILGSRLAFRPLMLLVIGVFCAGQALSALAPSYGLLMAARLVVACAHSVFWAIAAPVAVKVVDERHAPMAVSAVVTGSALAMVVGLPLGRMVGLWLGWRQTFGCVCAVSALVLAYLAVVFPKIPASKPFTLKQLPGILRNKVLMGIFLVTALYAMGYYTGYSYIEPFLLQVGGMDEQVVTMALVAFGIAGLVGSAICSRFYRGHRWAFAVWVVAGVALALALLRPAALGVVGVFAVCMLWGIAGSGYSIVYQAESHRVRKRWRADGRDGHLLRHLQPRHRHGQLHRRRRLHVRHHRPCGLRGGFHRAPCLTVLRIRADQTYESSELKVGPENNCSKSIISI